MGIPLTKESEVLAAMQAHITARINGDVDSVIDSYSEDWVDSKGSNKTSLRDGHLVFTTGATEIEVAIDLDGAEIVVEGNQANIAPVVIDTEKGRVTYSYKLKKEADGIWRLIYTQTLDWEPFPMDEATQVMKTEIVNLEINVLMVCLSSNQG